MRIELNDNDREVIALCYATRKKMSQKNGQRYQNVNLGNYRGNLAVIVTDGTCLIVQPLSPSAPNCIPEGESYQLYKSIEGVRYLGIAEAEANRSIALTIEFADSTKVTQSECIYRSIEFNRLISIDPNGPFECRFNPELANIGVAHLRKIIGKKASLITTMIGQQRYKISINGADDSAPFCVFSGLRK